jgi:magnesium transporter
MITILESTEFGLETINEFVNRSWVNVVDPCADEIVLIQRELGIPRDFITSPLDVDERARTEKENGTTLIVIRIPYYEGQTVDIPYRTIPLGVVLTEKCVVTVCKTDNDIVRELLNGGIKGLSTAKKNRFILHLLMSTANRYLRHLREINKAVDMLEDRLQLSMRNQEVLGLLKYEKSLVYFTTALRSNELVLERLQKSQLFKMYPEDEDLLEDVLTENQQAIEMTTIANNILSQMMDAFASIISNNLNAVMKFLASATIVLTIPTMIAGFYGMNVGLPLQGHESAFLVILAASIGAAALIILVFYRRDWF